MDGAEPSSTAPSDMLCTTGHLPLDDRPAADEDAGRAAAWRVFRHASTRVVSDVVACPCGSRDGRRGQSAAAAAVQGAALRGTRARRRRGRRMASAQPRRPVLRTVRPEAVRPGRGRARRRPVTFRRGTNGSRPKLLREAVEYCPGQPRRPDGGQGAESFVASRSASPMGCRWRVGRTSSRRHWVRPGWRRRVGGGRRRRRGGGRVRG